MFKVTTFSNFKEKIKIVKEEQGENRSVKVVGNRVYSYDKSTNKEYKNFKCNSCNTPFRVITTAEDIQYAICPRCGGCNVDYILGWKEKVFENQIK